MTNTEIVNRALVALDRDAQLAARNERNLNRWRVLRAWSEHTLSGANYRDFRTPQQRAAGFALDIEREYQREWLDKLLRARSVAEACAGQVPGNCRVLLTE